jgi:hypothetical protein
MYGGSAQVSNIGSVASKRRKLPGRPPIYAYGMG